jgi:hypothetical protein
MISLVLVLGALALADTPKIIFSQDPLCADSPKMFGTELDKARPLHMKFPQLRDATEAQNKWFTAVAGEMKSVCEADAKFALELVNKDRSALTGQCKPAAEAALADQEVLDHSEASLNLLKGRPAEYLLKGVKNGPESLWAIFQRDYYRVSVDSLDELDIPRVSACELQWTYPQAFLKMHPPITGCPEAPPGVAVSDADRKDAGIFAQMMTRYKGSVEYNTQRRNNALATALASKARYEACVAQNPGTENVLVKAKAPAAAGPSPTVPRGAAPVKGSDITGVKEDQEKQKR